MVQIERQGPPMTPTILNVVESRMGIRLPMEYRGFLLRSNGGKPRPGYVHIQNMPNNPIANVVDFFGINMPEEIDDVEWNYDHRPDQLPDGWIPIGRTESGDMLVLVTCRDIIGTIWLWDYYGEHTEHSHERRDLFMVSADIDSLLLELHDWHP